MMWTHRSPGKSLATFSTGSIAFLKSMPWLTRA